jgi:hypothetical protein
MEPKYQVRLKIRKPAAEVFEAVVDTCGPAIDRGGSRRDDGQRFCAATKLPATSIRRQMTTGSTTDRMKCKLMRRWPTALVRRPSFQS